MEDLLTPLGQAGTAEMKDPGKAGPAAVAAEMSRN